MSAEGQRSRAEHNSATSGDWRRVVVRLSDGTRLTDGPSDDRREVVTEEPSQSSLAAHAAFGPDRVPVQVCPRGCMHETAHRYVISHTPWWSGRAHTSVEFQFEMENCTVCGSALIATCARCDRVLRAPVADRCQFCGVPHPWAKVRQSTAHRTAPRAWRATEQEEDSPAITATPVFCTPCPSVVGEEPKPRVFLLAGDITDLRVDAIVSNADADGRMWTAIASSVKGSAGGDVERESVDKGPHNLGDAWCTDPGNLEHLKRVVHVAAIDRHGNGGDTGNIRRCVHSAVDVASALKLESIAIPAIGTGKNALSLDEWLNEVGFELGAWFEDHDRARIEVVVALLEPTDFDDHVDVLKTAAKRGALTRRCENAEAAAHPDATAGRAALPSG